MEDPTQPRRNSETCAWVNVIYGCNERCTFCVVPTTRGSEQSRPIAAIQAEISELVAEGYKEVTLLGQNIDSYGRDLKGAGQTFPDLLRAVGSTPGLARMRFVTSHPRCAAQPQPQPTATTATTTPPPSASPGSEPTANPPPYPCARYMSMRVIDAVAETPAVCEMFHIPVQSGDDDVLREMGRGYTVKRFKQIVANIRERCAAPRPAPEPSPEPSPSALTLTLALARTLTSPSPSP